MSAVMRILPEILTLGTGGIVLLIMLFCVKRVSARLDGLHNFSAALNRLFLKAYVKSSPTAGLHGNPAPTSMHTKFIDGIDSKTRLIIIGDVHGCLDELKLLLKQCNYKKEHDKIILVGDLVNKGPSSAGVVKFVREIGATSVRGNHDDAALSKALKAKANGDNLPAHYQYLEELNE